MEKTVAEHVLLDLGLDSSTECSYLYLVGHRLLACFDDQLRHRVHEGIPIPGTRQMIRC